MRKLARICTEVLLRVKESACASSLSMAAASRSRLDWWGWRDWWGWEVGVELAGLSDGVAAAGAVAVEVAVVVVVAVAVAVVAT